MGLVDHKHKLKASGWTIVRVVWWFFSFTSLTLNMNKLNTHFVVESLPSYGHFCQIINNKTNTLQINLNLK